MLMLMLFYASQDAPLDGAAAAAFEQSELLVSCGLLHGSVVQLRA